MIKNGNKIKTAPTAVDDSPCAIYGVSPFGKYCGEGAPAGLIHREFFCFNRDEVLFREKEEAAGVFCVNSGIVKLVKKGRDGKDYIVRLTKPGEPLGLTLFTSKTHTTTAIALDDVKACFIPRNDFINIFKSDPYFAMKLMKSVSRDIEIAERRIAGLCQKIARQRVAEILLILHSMYGTDKQQYLNISLTMKDFANFSCTSSATLSRLLSDFRKNGLIKINNHKIRLLEIKRLIQIAKITVHYSR